MLTLKQYHNAKTTQMRKTTQFQHAVELINTAKKSIRADRLKFIQEIDSKTLLVKAMYIIEDMMLTGAKKDKELMFPATPITCAVGRSISANYLTTNNITAEEAEIISHKAGWFVLSALANKDENAKFRTVKTNKIKAKVKKDENGELFVNETIVEDKRTYFIIKNVELFLKLSILMPLNLKDNPSSKRPTTRKPAPWKGFHHPSVGKLAGKCSRKVRRILSKRDHSNTRLFRMINKEQSVAYQLNEELLDIYNELYANDHFLFNFNNKSYDSGQLESKLREVDGVMKIANEINADEEYQLTKKFYHHNKLDFRYRKYTTTSWFAHDKGKIARSLHCLQPRKLTKRGLFYMFAALASASGEDKLSRVDRVHYAKKMLPVWLEWANNPVKTADVWGNEDVIDNPYEFMSILLQVKRYIDAEDKSSVDISVPIYLDAQNSGIAFLSAMSRDVKGMTATSLLESDEIGDAYMLIVENIAPKLEGSEDGEAILASLMDDMLSIDAQLREAKEKACESSKIKALKAKVEFINIHKENIALAARYYWSKFTKKQLRKTVKRSTLAIPYGSGVSTNSESSILGDFRNKYENLNIFLTDWLAQAIDDAFKVEFKKAKRLMVKFQAKAKKMAKKGQNYGFVVPFTNVLFEQEYRDGYVKQVKTYYNGREFKCRVKVSDQGKIKLDDARNGASANSVHACDAALLNYFVSTFGSDVVCIHDAFGTHPNDSHKAWRRLRVCMHQILQVDILRERVGITYFAKGKGKLDFIKKSEFCFS